MSVEPSEPLSLLPAPAPRAGCFVNARCVIHEQDGLRVAMVGGEPFHTWPVGDALAEDLFVVQARQAQVATIAELAEALGRPVRTLFHVLRRFAEGGVKGVVGKRRGRPPGSGRDVLRDAAIRRLHAGGLSGRAMAVQLKTSPGTVEKALARMGLESNVLRQRRLMVAQIQAGVAPPDRGDASAREAVPVGPSGSSSEGGAARMEAAGAAPVPVEEAPPSGPCDPPSAAALAPEGPVERSLDTDPRCRSVDRLLASRGELSDAAPLFASGRDLPYVGVLLGIPSLTESGLLPEARRIYGDIGPAFYGLRTSLVAIVLLSLLRLKRPEHLKEHAPPDLGRVLGLDRAPEVKTLRRKLHLLAEGRYDALLLAVAQRRAGNREEAVAWQYVDGHVRVYSGKERLPKTHVTRLRACMPAAQDVWVHDGDGRPVLFVTQEAHPSLASSLVPVLEASREATGVHNPTLVFDRGGWSPDLFATLLAEGAHVLTYRKGTAEPIPASWFEPCEGRPGDKEPWLLHDASVRLANGLWMRQITRLVGDHQTTIVTTRQDIPAAELARRMFDRWRQENFFKYMRQEFDLDGLCEYGAEDDDPLREAPNPEWALRDKLVRSARAAHKTALAQLSDPDHPEVKAALARQEELVRQRKAVPRRVTVAQLVRPTVRLPARTKNLYDGLKMLAWQIETDLFRALAPFYRRSEDEGRTLVTAALRSKGHLDVTDTELQVTLAPQSSPHRTHAIAKLCHLLDETETRFPGTNLRMRFRIEGVADGPLTASPSAT